MIDIEVEVLLEISLSVGSSLELTPMLDHFLSTSTRLLNSSAAIVHIGGGASELGKTYTHTLPATLSELSCFRSIITAVERADDASGATEGSFFVEVKKKELLLRYFVLGELGYLIYLGDDTTWSRSFSQSMGELAGKLAKSIAACLINEQLADKARRLDLATSSAGIGVWEWNLESGDMYWDEQIFKLYEVRPEDFTGTPEDFISRIHPEDRDEVVESVWAFAEQPVGQTAEFHFRIIGDKGAVRKIVGHGSKQPNPDGTLSLLGTNYDISEIERARAQSLERSEIERLLLSLSMKVIRATGSLDEVYAEALAEAGRYVGADRAYRFRYHLSCGTASNTHEWCADGIMPEIDNLQGVSVEGINNWIEAHRRGLPFYVTKVDELDDNDGVRKILEPQGIKSIATIPLMLGDEVYGFIGFDAVRDYRHWSDVDISFLKVLADLFMSAQVKHDRALEISRSATELARSRDEAKALAIEANQANHVKSQFLATVSHEVRTPLHAILAISDVLEEDLLSSRSRDRIKTLQNSGRHLLALIDDVLDFTSIESGQLAIRAHEFKLRDVLKEIELTFQPLAAEKGLTLRVEARGEVPESVEGDVLRITQILNNLLSNAIKFTRSGGVIVEVDGQHSGSSSRFYRIDIRVRDTGIGIGSDVIEKIFDPFFQEDGSSTRSFEGTGLGLAIVRMLVESMGFDISVESEVGTGTEFVLTMLLPSGISDRKEKTEEQGVKAASPRNDPSGLRILMAEDNVVNRQVASMQMESMGLDFDIAENGQEAVEMFADNVYDVVLMDCQMPVLDGYAATEKIRDIEMRTSATMQAKRARIIAVTASAQSEVIAACLKAGMDDILVKPFSKDQLYVALSNSKEAQS